MGGLARFVDRRAAAIVVCTLVIFAGAAFETFNLTYSGDRSQVLSSDAPYYRTLQAFHREFESQDAMFFVIRGEDVNANRSAGLDVGAQARADTAHFSSVLDRVDLSFVRKRMLLFLPLETLRSLRPRLETAHYVLHQILSRPALAPLFVALNGRVQALFRQAATSPGTTAAPTDLKQLAQGLPMLESLLESMTDSLSPDYVYRSPIAAFTSARAARTPAHDANAAVPSPTAATMSPSAADKSPAAADGSPSPSDESPSQSDDSSPSPSASDLATSSAAATGAASPSPSPPPHLAIPPFDLSQDLWVTFDQGQTLLVSVVPRVDRVEDRSRLVEADVVAARAIIAATQARWPQVRIELTGMPVIGAEEMNVAESDSVKSTLLSLVGLIVLFCLLYRNLKRPVLAMGCLIVSLVWTLGAMTLAVGHLNVLTVTVLPMLVGLGIDFGIQVIARYEEERTENRRAPAEAMHETLVNTGASILTAGLTTSVSFAVTILAGFAGTRELGILAGGGILISTFCMLVLLPAVILMADRSGSHKGSAMRGTCWRWLAAAERVALVHPVATLVAAFFMSVLCLSRVGDVTFNWNVLDLQDKTSPSVASAVHLLQDSNHSILTASVVADDLEQVRSLQKRLAAQRGVAGVMSVALVMPTDQAEKLELVRSLQSFLHSLPLPPDQPPPQVDLAALQAAIRGIRQASLVVFTDARRVGGRALGASLRSFVRAADDVLQSISDSGPLAQARLDSFQRSLYDDLFGQLRTIEGPEEATPMTYDVLPPVVRDQLVGKSGKLLVVVSPSDSMWDEAGMRSFLDTVRTVADATPSHGETPEVTGSIVQIYESTRLAIAGYERAAACALGAIVVLVFLHFGRIGASLLALAPLALGLLWMFGLQAMLDIPFNVISMLALPLILGIGVANGIYVVKRFEEEGTASIFGHSTGRAILQSNLAAIIGFGSLMISRYAGMYAFGALMALGVATCGIASLGVLPAILTLLSTRRSSASASAVRGAQQSGVPALHPAH